jgi:glycolate oxidase FAD binding subunit
MKRLDAIEFYDPGDLTVGVGAGCTAATLNEKLMGSGQFLPFDVSSAKHATIGGILATAAHGPLRHGYGAVRDFCIGITFVTGDGKIAKGGGRVVKNVTGYDLMKLLIGSHGTLGVITSANFKVFPLARQTKTFILKFSTLREALEFCDRIQRSPLAPIALELINARALEDLAEQPNPPRDPDHFSPQGPIASAHRDWELWFRAAGSEPVITRYRRELGQAIAKEIDGGEEASAWEALANLVLTIFARHRNAMASNISFSPADAQKALDAVENVGLDNNLLPAIFGHIALGAMLVVFTPLSVDPPSAMQYVTAISALRAELPDGASCVVTRCPTEAKRHFDVWGPSRTDLSSMRAVKRALDPKNILNRGRFLV